MAAAGQPQFVVVEWSSLRPLRDDIRTGTVTIAAGQFRYLFIFNGVFKGFTVSIGSVNVRHGHATYL
jgi:hypothetical protein